MENVEDDDFCHKEDYITQLSQGDQIMKTKIIKFYYATDIKHAPSSVVLTGNTDPNFGLFVGFANRTKLIKEWLNNCRSVFGWENWL